MENWVQSWRPRTNGLCDFSAHPVYSTAPATKKWCQVTEVLHLSRKIIFPKLKIWCSKMQPLSGNQHPDLLTSLMNISLVLRLPREMHLSRSSSNVPRLPSFLEMRQNPHVLLTFDKVAQSLVLAMRNDIWTSKSGPDMWFLKLRNVLRATTACTISTCQLPKVLRDHQFLTLLTLKCASRHNGVHFFDMSTSKSGPNMVCFVHFDLEMRFAPQRRALFRPLNFQKSSEHEVLCTFWLPNVLRATAACKCSSLIWPDCSAPAALASLLFNPPEPQINWKNTVFRDFPTLSPTCIFFPPTLSLLLSSLFCSSLLWLFPSLLFICPYCRKFDF